MDENTFKCSTEDYGVSWLISKEMESWRVIDCKPQSNWIAQDKIGILNRSTQSNKYKVTITDLHADRGEGSGTRVEIILPLITL